MVWLPFSRPFQSVRCALFCETLLTTGCCIVVLIPRLPCSGDMPCWVCFWIPEAVLELANAKSKSLVSEPPPATLSSPAPPKPAPSVVPAIAEVFVTLEEWRDSGVSEAAVRAGVTCEVTVLLRGHDTACSEVAVLSTSGRLSSSRDPCWMTASGATQSALLTARATTGATMAALPLLDLKASFLLLAWRHCCLFL